MADREEVLVVARRKSGAVVADRGVAFHMDEAVVVAVLQNHHHHHGLRLGVVQVDTDGDLGVGGGAR